MLRVDWNLLLTIINLLLLFVLMRIFLFKPVQKIIAARQEEADRQFKEAGESKQAAEEARKQYEASLANAEEAKKQVLQRQDRPQMQNISGLYQMLKRPQNR